MKRLFFLLLAAVSLAGCDKGNDAPSSITGYDPDQLHQTLYADQTSGPGDFTFTAAESWSTQVRDVTRSTASDTWVTLDPAQGGPGTVHMKITLSPNLTGADRKAQITIACDETTLTITVEQKATTESGGGDPEPANRKIVRIDVENDYINDYSGEEYTTFRYEDDMVVELKTTETEVYKGTLQHTWVTTTSIDEVVQPGGGAAISVTTMESVDGKAGRMLVEAIAQLENGRVTSCTRNGVDYDKIEEGKAWSDRFTLSYDAAGYLTGCVRVETDNDEDNFYSTWLGGNYTKVVWGSGSGIDEAVYGNTAYKNNANLDLNAFFVLDSEGFDFSFGGQDKIFALCGYTGKRSANLATKVTETWTGQNLSPTTYTYEFDGMGYPIKIHAVSHDPVNNQVQYTTTYKITYNQ